MRTGVFVVGALREIKLCSKSWQIPYSANWHLLTWTRTTDRFIDGSRAANFGVLDQIEQSFNSFHVFDKEREYPWRKDWNKQLYWAQQGPWFWEKLYQLYPDYERYIIIRPDLFLWSKPERGWSKVPQGRLHTLGKRQDQMFVADNYGMRFLSRAQWYIAMAPNKYPSIHDYLGEYLEVDGAHLGIDYETLDKAFHYTLARPNSRFLEDSELNADVAQKVFEHTAMWWRAYTGQAYQGTVVIT